MMQRLTILLFAEMFSIRCVSHSVVSDSLRYYELLPAGLLCPWDSPSKNSEVGCHALLQGIFPTQESNPCLSVSCIGRWFLYH